MDERERALDRFGLGARIGERRTITDPRGWLHDQLAGPPPLLTDGVLGEEEIWARIVAFQEARRGRDRDAIQKARVALKKIFRQEAVAALDARVATDRPFLERLVAFWSNHLCVSVAADPLVGPLAGLYERQVVRPHVLGRFRDMVLASAHHPAMLIYLDNLRSIGPGSPVARRARRRLDRELGFNENYARELLELHTLGVDGGYGQEDVVELARLLTGWTVAGVQGGVRPGERPGFAFRKDYHEPGRKRVLGEEYGEGEEEGRRAVRDLCRHPATARCVATKLAVHFVADDPPPAAIRALAETFRETDGDLQAVSERLISLEEAWDPANRKFRTPQDWLVAALRAVTSPEAPPAPLALLGRLRHRLWAPEAPRGYGDLEREWADPDNLLKRGEFARVLASRAPKTLPDPRRLLQVVRVAQGDPLRRLLTDESIDRVERTALALASPAFQWR